jgi:two-component system nitrate/nitrite response regulator NarL
VVRVLLVALDPLAAAGLAALLANEPALVVVGHGPSAADLPQRMSVALPDVVAFDLGAGPSSAIEALGESVPQGVPLLALVGHADDAQSALRAGARGAIFRDADPARLAAALVAVAQGLFVAEEGLAEFGRRRARDGAGLVEPLTPREREVLDLLVQGLTNRRIGEGLGISEHTAKFHVNAILGKLGVESRTEAVAEAARLGLVMF